MADMTITITVTASIGGQSFAWSRTATVENLDAAVYGLTSTTNELIGSTESEEQVADGIYSYSGAAVICAVHTNPGTLVNIGATCSDGGQRGRFLAAAFVPALYYNGAGTGFTGGVNASATNTDTPTIDIVAPHYEYFTGNGPVAALIGLKAIS